MKQLRIGIIGVGIIGRQHLDNYAKMAGVSVVAACDLNAELLESVGARYGIPHRYADYRALLARDDLDAVDVCVHNNLHAPITVDVLKSGKHAYCEKPMAGAWADAKAMLDAARATKRMLHIQLAFLYTAETRAAQRLIDAGRLGNVYHARSVGYRRRGRPFVDGYATKEFDSRLMAAGGALYDMGVYHISQILHLLGRPVLEKVSGQVYQELDMDAKRRAESGFDVEELGVGFAKFKNNLTLDILESWAIHAGDFGGSMICGSQGGVSLSPLNYYSFIDDMSAVTTFGLHADETRAHALDPALARYDSSQAHWAAALRGEVALLPTAEIALDTMLISEGIYMSGRLGREVTADEIRENSLSLALRTQDAPFGTIEYAPYPFL